jgi:hypothetical protein
VFGIMLLVISLIHVAPLDSTPRTKDVLEKQAKRGYARVDAHPWARIFVDDKEVGTTPIAEALELKEGKHVVRYEHSWYQPHVQEIDVTAGTKEAAPIFRVDFEKENLPLKPGKTKP